MRRGEGEDDGERCKNLSSSSSSSPSSSSPRGGCPLLPQRRSARRRADLRAQVLRGRGGVRRRRREMRRSEVGVMDADNFSDRDLSLSYSHFLLFNLTASPSVHVFAVFFFQKVSLLVFFRLLLLRLVAPPVPSLLRCPRGEGQGGARRGDGGKDQLQRRRPSPQGRGPSEVSWRDCNSDISRVMGLSTLVYQLLDFLLRT